VQAPFDGPVNGEPYVDIMQILLELAKRAGVRRRLLRGHQHTRPPEAGVSAQPSR